MARPRKQEVDYFPHYCDHGKTLFILESRFQNDGYAVFYKLEEILAKTEGHCYDCSLLENWEYFLSKMNTTEEIVIAIIDKLVAMNVIDGPLWQEKRLWMQSFVDSISDAYTRRKVDVPVKPELMSTLIPLSGQKDDINPQSKVNKTKENKNIMSDVESVRLAELLFSEILKQQPKSKLHALNNGRRQETIARWADDIEKLKRIDKRPIEDIERVISWVTADSFWKSNILSGAKLREKWDTLVAQMERTAGSDAYDW